MSEEKKEKKQRMVYLESVKPNEYHYIIGCITTMNEDETYMVVNHHMECVRTPNHLWKSHNQLYQAIMGSSLANIYYYHRHPALKKWKVGYVVAIRNRNKKEIYYGTITLWEPLSWCWNKKIMEISGYVFQNVNKSKTWTDVQGQKYTIGVGSTIGMALREVAKPLEKYNDMTSICKGHISRLHPAVKCKCCFH